MEIQHVNNRISVCDQTMALHCSTEYIAAQAEAARIAKTTACCNRITEWCNIQDHTSPFAMSKNLFIGMEGINESDLSAWEQELTSIGYTVTRQNGAFIVSHD